MTLKVSYSRRLCHVLTAERCQVGSSSSQSTSGSMEPEQLPWQHWRNRGAPGTLTYDIGTISVHTRLPHSHCQMPLTSNTRRTFTYSQGSPKKRSSNIRKIIHNNSTADLPNTPTSCNVKAFLQPCTPLYLIFLSLPLPSAPTHTCLHCPAKQQCGA